jgi:site-specific DNA recombinase
LSAVNGEKKRCYVYARLSTEDQHRRAEYSSLESQEKVCKAYIASQEPNGWKYVTTIKDLSSGGNTDRPGLSELLEHIKQNKVDVVVTTKMDRLTRNIKDFWTLYEVMQEYDCQFVCATQELNSTTAHGRFFINILMSFAEFELETIRERTRAKMLSQAEEGLWHGGRAPFGYERHKDRKGLLIPHKIEAAVVKKIFDLFVKLGSPAAVAKEINGMGYRTKSKKKTKFSKWTITYILSNPLYIGKTTFGGQSFDGKHKALIPVNRFNHVQKMLEKNKQTRTGPTQNKYNFRLRGILKCGDCGSMMTPSPAKSGRYLYYRCTRVSKYSKEECKVRKIGARAIEDAVVNKLCEIGTDEAVIKEAVRKANKASTEGARAKAKELNGLIGELRPIQEAIDNSVRYIEQHADLPKAMAERLPELETRKEQLETQIQRLEFDIGQLKDYQIDTELLTKTLQDFRAIYNELTPEEQTRLLQLMVQEVVLGEDTLKIYVFPLGDSGKPLEYLLRHPEFAESDKKRG